MRQQLRQAGGQTAMRRELANQRRAFGEAGRQRAMRNWGIRESRPTTGAKGAKGARGGGSFSGRNG